MALKRITTQAQIDNYLLEEIIKREEKFIKALQYLGMQCIMEARNNGDYIDQTGNLRSSIGYVVLRDGQIVNSSDFKIVKGKEVDGFGKLYLHKGKWRRRKKKIKLKGKKGQQDGKKLISELVKNHNKGIALIVVAGMNYAAYVETRRNVLSSSELFAKSQVPILLEKLGFKNDEKNRT